MLDLKYVLANVELVKQNCRDRHVSPEILEEIDHVVRLDGEYRIVLRDVEELRRRQNEVAQSTGKEKDPAKRAELVSEGKGLKTTASEKEETLRALEAELKDRLGRVPNMTHPDAPVGSGDDANVELRIVGTPRTFSFKPKDHLEIGRALDLIDFETGGKVSGSGFYFLKNDAVMLDLALQQFAMQKLARAGFTPVITPGADSNP